MATINPFQPPINYAVDVQSPFEAALGGFKLGAGVAEIQAAKQAREKAQATQTELANLFKNPLATAADYDRVAAFLPKDQAAIVTQGFERKTKEQQANDLRMGAEVYSAIKSGNLPVAKQMLTDQATAFRNSGREDKAKAIEDSIKIIDLNPTGAQATIGLYMARLPGGTDFLNNADKALSIIRTEALAKSTLDKAVADASAAVADAQKKVAEAADTPSRLLAEADYRAAQTALQRAQTAASEGEEARKLTKFGPELAALQATATVKQIEAKYAPDKFLTDLNLTKEQIEQAKAARKASDAAAKESGAKATRLEAEAAQMALGIIPVEKRPEVESKFRKEYNDQTQPYQTVKSAYGRVLSSDDSAVGDLSLIFGYMKMLDPGSVVREGEFATAQNAAGVPERIINIYNKLITGERLTASQRNSFKGQAKGLYNSALEGEKTIRTGLDRIAKGYGLNTANIFYTPTEVEPTAQTAAPPLPTSATVGGQTYTRPPGFTDAQWRDYLKSQGVTP